MTKNTIASRRSDQTLYVYVTDQKYMPVKDAEVTFTLRDAAGEQTFTMPRTDANCCKLAALCLRVAI